MTATASKQLAILEGKLATWRRTHRPPSPIPEELWDEAVDMAVAHGLYQTARTLHLDYGALKKRVAARDVGTACVPPATFVELIAPTSSTVAECALEVQKAGGATLRIAIKGVPPAVLTSIIREFVG